MSGSVIPAYSRFNVIMRLSQALRCSAVTKGPEPPPAIGSPRWRASQSGRVCGYQEMAFESRRELVKLLFPKAGDGIFVRKNGKMQVLARWASKKVEEFLNSEKVLVEGEMMAAPPLDPETITPVLHTLSRNGYETEHKILLTNAVPIRFEMVLARVQANRASSHQGQSREGPGVPFFIFWSALRKGAPQRTG